MRPLNQPLREAISSWLPPDGAGQAALAAVSGLLLGLRFQLYYLSAVQWQAPGLRAGALAGLLLGALLWAGLRRLLRRGLAVAGLGLTVLAAWWTWPLLDRHGAFHLLPALLLIFLLLGGPGRLAGQRTGGALAPGPHPVQRPCVTPQWSQPRPARHHSPLRHPQASGPHLSVPQR